MTEVMKKLKQVNVEQKQLAILGLRSDWQQSVSPEFVTRAVNVAEKHKGVLKELAKY